MTEVFQPLKVYHYTLGGTLVQWSLNPLFKATLPYTFKVYASEYAGSQDFELIATVHDDNHFIVDPKQRTFSKDFDIEYRVDLVDGDNNVYSSRVCDIQGQLNRYDYLQARAIIQRETLWITKFGGTCGFLWKRRRWGPTCSTCADWDTSEPTRGSCPECYGTGITGGYYSPITFYIGSTGGQNAKKSTDPSVGVTDAKMFKGRTLICPDLDTTDVWCNAVTDQRYIVGNVSYVYYKMVPILIDPAELKLAPATDAVYNLARPDEITSSSSSSSSG